MRKLISIIMISFLLLFTSCAITKDKSEEPEVSKYSYRLENIHKTKYYINIPNELPNFTEDYYENSRVLPPFYKSDTESLFYALYPVPYGDNERYGIIIHTHNNMFNPIMIEHCSGSDCDYWIYKNSIPVKSNLEEVRLILAKLQDDIESRE
jgi:hypothetical protein